MTILLVDESKFFLTIEAQMLKNTPCKLIEAGGVEEMFAVCRQQRPELIYLAASLTAVDGIEGCRRLKADAQLRSIPVVLICEPGKPEQLATAQAAGCDATLAKPLDRNSFLDVGSRFVAQIREPRRSCLFEVDYRWRDLHLCGKCLDINSGGLFLQGPDAVTAGDMLSIEFSLPKDGGAPIGCSAQVAWVNLREKPLKAHYPLGFGIKFTNITPHDMKRIRAFLKG